MSGEEWIVLGPVLAGVILGIGKGILTVFRYMIEATADRVVDRIGDKLEERFDANLKRQLRPIGAELRTNKGTSLKDQVGRIDMRLGNVEQQIEAWLTERTS